MDRPQRTSPLAERSSGELLIRNSQRNFQNFNWIYSQQLPSCRKFDLRIGRIRALYRYFRNSYPQNFPLIFT